jgi:hypothetical protein
MAADKSTASVFAVSHCFRRDKIKITEFITIAASKMGNAEFAQAIAAPAELIDTPAVSSSGIRQLREASRRYDAIPAAFVHAITPAIFSTFRVIVECS